MKRAMTQNRVNKKRIAVWVFYDLTLPLQRGKPGDKEREESNKEIEEVFKKSKYYPKKLSHRDKSIQFSPV